MWSDNESSRDSVVDLTDSPPLKTKKRKRDTFTSKPVPKVSVFIKELILAWSNILIWSLCMFCTSDIVCLEHIFSSFGLSWLILHHRMCLSKGCSIILNQSPSWRSNAYRTSFMILCPNHLFYPLPPFWSMLHTKSACKFKVCSGVLESSFFALVEGHSRSL